jgi:hypothetical protein
MPEASHTHEGGCLCGAVRYRTTAPLRDVIVCHCSVCRRSHGGPAPFSAVPREHLEVTRDDGLTWHERDAARRAFCNRCGSRLFWDRGGESVSIAAGTLDEPTGLRTIRHIFVASQADWEDSIDGIPGSSRGVPL